MLNIHAAKSKLIVTVYASPYPSRRLRHHHSSGDGGPVLAPARNAAKQVQTV